LKGAKLEGDPIVRYNVHQRCAKSFRIRRGLLLKMQLISRSHVQ